MARAGESGMLEIDWLPLLRGSVERLRAMFDLHPTTGERGERTGRGAGGDEALVIDRRAEAVLFEALDELHEQGHAFTVISEERGKVTYGDGSSPVTVVIDPIDGSLNAKRMIPTCALSVAVAAGSTMEDVELGYVYDFGTGEEYVARQRGGSEVDGQPIDPYAPDHGLEVVGFEAARPSWIAPVAERLGEDVYRVRVVGSVAVSLCYVAAARFDGMLTMNTCRSVDAAAGQLIAREAGGFVSVLGYGGIEAPLDLDARFRIAAARTPEGLETLVRALTDAGPPPE